ncbi:MAG: response regulator transcription factor [Gemmatimonadales bacterium]|nr:response regulator transcription factor [Gemmatimonadales bacterium]
MSVIQVAIVEDRFEVREGLAALVNRSADCRCVGSFPAAEPLLLELGRGGVDVVLMDIELPGMSGIEATRLIRQRWPRVQVMMLTVYEDDDRIFRSLQAGATGYVLKKTPPVQLLRDIESLHRGGSPMSSGIARRVVETFHAAAATAGEQLTVREREILELLTKGFRYREIAERLEITFDTVRTHIRNIYEKMQVRSRTEAAVKYLRNSGA